jgi:hypothetical protein
MPEVIMLTSDCTCADTRDSIAKKCSEQRICTHLSLGQADGAYYSGYLGSAGIRRDAAAIDGAREGIPRQSGPS